MSSTDPSTAGLGVHAAHCNPGVCAPAQSPLRMGHGSSVTYMVQSSKRQSPIFCMPFNGDDFGMGQHTFIRITPVISLAIILSRGQSRNQWVRLDGSRLWACRSASLINPSSLCLCLNRCSSAARAANAASPFSFHNSYAVFPAPLNGLLLFPVL